MGPYATGVTKAAEGSSGGTASADEIARFAAIADAWWDPAGDFRPLHQLNPTRIAYTRDALARHYDRAPLAPRPLQGLRVLDVGCGGGLMAEPLTRLGAAVTGIDADAMGVGVAEAHARSVALDIRYRCCLPEDLVAEGLAGTFDAVVSMEVIEHVSDPDAFLDACATLLRSRGVLVLATLNRTLKSLALAKIGAEYILRWLPAGTHDWRKFVRPSELARGMRRAGLTLTDISGMSFNPLTGTWSLSRDLDVNYLVSAVKSGASGPAAGA